MRTSNSSLVINQWGLDAAAATYQGWSDRITRMTDTDKAKIMAAGGLFKAHLEAFDPSKWERPPADYFDRHRLMDIVASATTTATAATAATATAAISAGGSGSIGGGARRRRGLPRIPVILPAILFRR